MFERLARRLWTWRGLDLRSARARLAGLGARHVEISAVASLDDEPATAGDRLLDVALSAAERARHIRLSELAARGAPRLVQIWPGEHYRLLAALVEVERPRTVVEVGTHQGSSALAMLGRLGPDATLTTFDLVPWDRIDGTLLRPADFDDGRLRAATADLGDAAVAARHADLLGRADLVFLDAAKDGALEPRLLANLAAAGLRRGALVVLDDIRVWNMLAVWRAIHDPKLDLTSFGHWSGTGLVDWRGEIPPAAP